MVQRPRESVGEVAQRSDQERAGAHSGLTDLEPEDRLGALGREALAVAVIAERFERPVRERNGERGARVEGTGALPQPTGGDEVDAPWCDHSSHEGRGVLLDSSPVLLPVRVPATRQLDSAGRNGGVAGPRQGIFPCRPHLARRGGSGDIDLEGHVIAVDVICFVGRLVGIVVTRVIPGIDGLLGVLLERLEQLLQCCRVESLEARKRERGLATDSKEDDWVLRQAHGGARSR